MTWRLARISHQNATANPDIGTWSDFARSGAARSTDSTTVRSLGRKIAPGTNLELFATHLGEKCGLAEPYKAPPYLRGDPARRLDDAALAAN